MVSSLLNVAMLCSLLLLLLLEQLEKLMQLAVSIVILLITEVRISGGMHWLLTDRMRLVHLLLLQHV